MQQTDTSAGDGQRTALPIFYRRPRPIDAVLDSGRSLQPISDFRFARVTNSVLLGAAEFPRAMRSYPIVFTSREPRVAVAVLGLEGDENLFVDEDGKWRQGDYIPAYVRRCPFIFLEQPGNFFNERRTWAGSHTQIFQRAGNQHRHTLPHGPYRDNRHPDWAGDPLAGPAIRSACRRKAG